jgi:tetratricopeptide (TPR) repeat protein
MHADAAREFWGLASKFEKGRESDKGRALLMHTLSGQEFLRAKDNANAEARFAAALRIAPNDASALSGRAQCRIAVEKYWDALDDLDRALKTHPDDAAALRLRGRVWIALGNDRNAKEDFAHAHAVDGGGAKP